MHTKKTKALSNDMTKGREEAHIIRFALPLLAGNLLQQLYNIADTMIVGRYLGDDALAAVGATGSITYLFYTICIGLAIGAGVMLAQYFGACHMDEMKLAIFNSAIVTLLFGIAISVGSVCLAKPLLVQLGTPDKLLELAVRYMKIACAGTVAVALYNWIQAVMRSLGDSKTPLVFLGIASILNVLLDFVFVVGMHAGVAGAATATIIAQGISAVSCTIYAFTHNEDMHLAKKHLKIDGHMMVRCVKTGIPIAIQNTLVSISMVAIQRVTNSFGKTVMAAYTVSMRIEQFVQQPFSSLNAAISTFTGQNTGAGKERRVIRGLYTGLVISSAFSLLVCFLFALWGKNLTSCFVRGNDVVRISAKALFITSCCYIFLGAIHVARGFLNGTGDTGYAMINGIVEVVCRIGLSVLLTRIASIGYWGIWLTTCFTWFATACISLLRCKQGKWKEKSIVK